MHISKRLGSLMWTKERGPGRHLRIFKRWTKNLKMKRQEGRVSLAQMKERLLRAFPKWDWQPQYRWGSIWGKFSHTGAALKWYHLRPDCRTMSGWHCIMYKGAPSSSKLLFFPEWIHLTSHSKWEFSKAEPEVQAYLFLLSQGGQGKGSKSEG